MSPSSRVSSLALAQTLLTQGQVARAAETARAWGGRRGASRADRYQAALFCLGADSHAAAIELLHARVRGSRHAAPSPTPNEQIVYARALTGGGAFEEASRLLSAPSVARQPLAFLALCLVRGFSWDWVPPEEIAAFIGSVELSRVNRAVAWLRLSTSHILGSGNYDEGRRALRETWRAAGAEPALAHIRVGAAQHEGHLALLARDWRALPAALARMRETSGVSPQPGIAELRMGFEALGRIGAGTGTRAAAFEAVLQSRARLVAAGWWGMARMLDYHLARVTGIAEVWARLYYGTPFVSARLRFAAESASAGGIASTYRLRLGPGDCGPVLHLREAHVPEGGVVHRTLDALVSEVYRPLDTVAVYRAIYPDEWFEPHSSPVRVRQAVSRLRRLFEERRFPAQIRAGLHGHELHASRSCRIEITFAERAPGPATHPSASTRALREAFREKGEWRAAELSSRLGVSQPTVSRLLQVAEGEGWLRREGRARATRYRSTLAGSGGLP